jgi:hypothetical protein
VNDTQRNVAIGAVFGVGVIILGGFLVALIDSHAGEIASALGGVIGRQSARVALRFMSTT